MVDFSKKGTAPEIDPTEYEAEVRLTEMALTQSYLTLKKNRRAVSRLFAIGNALVNKDFQVIWQCADHSWKLPNQRSNRGAFALAKAKRNLERTRSCSVCRAHHGSNGRHWPVCCRTGTQLAKIYSIDYVEVRLPLHSATGIRQSARRISFKPQTKSRTDQSRNEARIGQQSFPWEGRISRTEGVFDANSPTTSVVGTDPQSL